MQKADGGLGSLDLRALHLLGSILETRSVTRTAEAFGLSQPAASRALEQLRRALGDRLVVRGSAGGSLTPRAQALVPLVKEAIEAVGRVFAAFRRSTRPQREPWFASRRRITALPWSWHP